jgi:3-hydroxyacyl-CoA dehydrogenase/enoyl-CoA hydratase/3-hydroxybutyryl-CoA epimerase/enoyl-CoA isomerase
MLALKGMQEGATLGRDAALAIEAKYFAQATATPQANALIGVFLADQMVKKAAGAWEKKSARQVNQAAVLGAGIMGGGIAYQAAVKGLPSRHEGHPRGALTLGMNEAGNCSRSRSSAARARPKK